MLMPTTSRRIHSGPARSRAYRRWIRTLSCVVCQRPPSEYCRIEAAHTKVLGSGGMRQKPSDFSTIPLCFWHHRGRRDSYHSLGEKRFAERHRIDLSALVKELIARYHERP